MERDSQKESEIQRGMPNVQVPAIKFIPLKNLLYVQMNIRSFVVSPQSKEPFLHQGFMFAVESKGISLPKLRLEGDLNNSLNIFLELEMPAKSLPKIQLVGDFPTLFHPHFTSRRFGFSSGEWVDYKKKNDEDIEKDLGSYILRVARSLKYEEGYIKPDTDQIGNEKALKWYKDNHQSDCFPTDNVQLPSGKTFEIRQNLPIHGYHPSPVQHQLRRKVAFEVIESKSGYSPTENIKPDFKLLSQYNSSFRGRSEDFTLNHEFYLTETAFKVVSNYIQWGQQTQENVVEQGGILLGSAFRDSKTGVIYGIAEQAIPGKQARGTSSYLEVTHETWKEMLDDVDKLSTALQVIGWYHTHPNNLDVFMSGTDCATQSRLFGNNWQFAIVLNPHRCIWRAFYGSSSNECRGYVFETNTSAPSC